MGKNVLVVDGDIAVLGSVDLALKKMGYGVTPSFSVQRAIALMNRPGWDNFRFDLIVTEFRVRGEDGVKVAREAKRRFAGVAVVMTADKVHDKARGGELDPDNPPEGIDRILFKQFDFSALKDAVVVAITKAAAALDSAKART